MKTARQVLRERSALSALRVAARAYAQRIAAAQRAVAEAGARELANAEAADGEARALDAIHAAEDASKKLEAAAVRFAEASPARRKRGRK